MNSGDTVHLGDGVYLHFDGVGFELRANHHVHPTDRVYLDVSVVKNLLTYLDTTGVRDP